MRVGIGLPNVVGGADPALLIPWAQAAERGRFSSLAVHDRPAYDGWDSLASLALAAGVTSRLTLATLVTIAPLRRTSSLAREAVTINRVSGGRLVLGLGTGPRRDDYDAARVPYRERGRILDAQLLELPGLFGDGRPRVLLGGLSDRALLRMARHGDGYVHGGGPPRAFRSAAVRALVAWSDSGRPGRPELWGLAYFALGRGAAERGRTELLEYYGFTGGLATGIAAGLLTEPAQVGEFARSYREAGCDELVLFPTIAELSQVDRLADAVELVRGEILDA